MTVTHNMRPRLVFCPSCLTDHESAEMEPVCSVCRSKLITVVWSVLSGERLTGAPMPVLYADVPPKPTK